MRRFCYFNQRSYGLAMGLLLSCTSMLSSNTRAQNTEIDYPGDIPQYVEQAIEAGIEHQYTGAWEFFVGGGVSSFDCNADRFPDLFIAGGETSAGLYINRSKPGQALQFEHDKASNLALKGVLGSYPVDIDNDGHLDLVLLRLGANQLFKGGENCTFTAANSLWNFDGGNAWTTAFSASFEKGQHFPSLAIGNYVDRTAPGSPWGTCDVNELHRPTTLSLSHATTQGAAEADKANSAENADKQSRDKGDLAQHDIPQYLGHQALTPGYCALSMLFTDWNKSGTDSLRVTNDRHYYRGGQEQLWRFDRGEYPRLFSRADGWEPLIIWGMGIAETDLNADGYPEYALTSMGDTKLQVLDLQQAIDENRPVYEDMAWARQATAHRPYTGDDLKPSTGWHSQFADVNNDARTDLFIAKGNVENMQDFARFDPDNLLLGTHTNTFSEQGEKAGLAKDTRGRGANVVDLNADGLLDIIVVNREDNVSLFRHTGMQHDDGPRAGGNWLKVELQQNGANRHAVGATLSIKTGNLVQTRRVQVGGGHASGTAGFVHVGLGVAERATLRIQWPDQQWSAPYKLFANHHVIVKREQDTALQWFAVGSPD